MRKLGKRYLRSNLAIIGDNPIVPAYYLDFTNGNDSFDGRTPATAWQTVAKVNASTFVPGDQILFKRGETWTGTTLLPPSSGLVNNYIYFGVYGSGINPVIEASNRASSMQDNGQSYLHFSDLHFRYGTGTTVNLSSGNNIVMDGCTIEGTGSIKANGIEIYGSAAYNIDILNCIIKNNGVRVGGGGGILINAASGAGPDNILIQGCTVYNNGTSTTLDHGIYIGRASNITVKGCSVYSNSSRGIQVNASGNISNITVERNNSYSNVDGVGLITVPTGTTLILRNNFINNNTGVGIRATTGVLDGDIWHNTIVNNATNGIRISAGVTGLDIRNNCVVQNSGTVGNTAYCIWVDSTTILQNNTINYNNYYYPGQSLSRVNQVGGTAQTFSAWQGNTGTPDASGTNLNPLFITDFTDVHLQAGSLIRNVGINVGVTDDYDGNSRPMGASVDIGAFEYVE